MLSSLRKNIKYLEEVSLAKAVMFFILVPLTIVLLNTDFLKDRYADTILDYTLMIIYPLVVGRRELLLNPIGSTKKTINISVKILIASTFLTWLGIAIVGSDNPQGLNGVVYTTEEYLKMTSLLPMIGFGEEFICVFTFMSLFSLLTGGKVRKFLICLISASFIFGFMHAFYSPITAIPALALGHIPYIFATFYYRSIIPAIIVHITWDGLSFFGHYSEGLYYLFFAIVYVIYLIYILIPKKKTVPQ